MGESKRGRGEKSATYLINDCLDKGGETRVDVIGNHTDAFGLPGINRLFRVARHVLLKHGLDIPALPLVLGKDGLAAQETALLGAVPVELNRVLRLSGNHALVLEEGPQDLEDGDGTAAIIVGAGSRENAGEPQVQAVLVGADNNGAVGLAGNGDDGGALGPRVLEHARGHGLVGAGLGNDVVDAGEEPLRGLSAVIGFVVTGVEASELLQVALHLILGKVVEEGADGVLLLALLGEFDGGAGLQVVGAEVFGVRDVHEALSVLERVATPSS